jgi:proline iminopeptidase
MSVGFSTGQNVGVWDGQSWSEQPTPTVLQQQQPQPARQQQKQQLQPPPKPMGVEACAAACAALSDSQNLLSLTLHSRDLSGSSWFSAMQQHQQQPCITNTAASVSAATHECSAIKSNKSSPDKLQRRHRRNGGAAAASGSSHSACTASQPAAVEQPQQQEPSVLSADLQLIERGLQHRGFREHTSAQALLEAHYSVHAAFLQQQPLLSEMDRIRNIPCIAVQGQWDLVCPPTTAVELGQVWPEMELRLVPRAGHSMYDPAITHELVTATDRMRALEPWCPAARGDAAAASLAGVF